jgi:hypothetical protein
MAKKVTDACPVDARWWKWGVVMGWAWQHPETITILECRAYGMTLRWRTRRATAIGKRFAHLLDSQAGLGASAKGRSSRATLKHCIKKNNAVILAGFVQPILGFTRSHTNPSDKPSRWATPKKRPAPTPPRPGREGAAA